MAFVLPFFSIYCGYICPGLSHECLGHLEQVVEVVAGARVIHHWEPQEDVGEIERHIGVASLRENCSHVNRLWWASLLLAAISVNG